MGHGPGARDGRAPHAMRYGPELATRLCCAPCIGQGQGMPGGIARLMLCAPIMRPIVPRPGQRPCYGVCIEREGKLLFSVELDRTGPTGIPYGGYTGIGPNVA